jgi:hypothetical protein
VACWYPPPDCRPASPKGSISDGPTGDAANSARIRARPRATRAPVECTGCAPHLHCRRMSCFAFPSGPGGESIPSHPSQSKGEKLRRSQARTRTCHAGAPTSVLTRPSPWKQHSLTSVTVSRFNGGPDCLLIMGFRQIFWRVRDLAVHPHDRGERVRFEPVFKRKETALFSP